MAAATAGSTCSTCTERPVIRANSLEFFPFSCRCVLGSSSHAPTLCSAGATTHATYHCSLHDICCFLSHSRFLSPPNKKPSMSSCLAMSSSCPPSAYVQVPNHFRDHAFDQVAVPTVIFPKLAWASSRNILCARLKARVPFNDDLLCSFASCRRSSFVQSPSVGLGVSSDI